MVKVIEVQGTPNPDALKFITDNRLVERGALSFENADSAKTHALGEALFAAGPVASVFILDRFVTVTKRPDADWENLEPLLKSIIETRGEPVKPAVPAPTGTTSNDEIRARIEQIIDENIRPALAGDGGGLEILDYQDGLLTVHYQGACGSCPSASAGTLFAIQNLLQRMLDPRIRVVTV
ncbi:MAG: NifU family protein [Elusimicrobia bacterium]|nr:NifU family protein [Elusimicrobiota bacterium]MBP9127657.1 NifU family protein [Elusimicrobiota bacterium]